MFPLLGVVPGTDWPLRSYQLLLIAASVLCLAFGPRWIERTEGISASRVRNALLLMTVAAVVGGRAHFVLIRWSEFAAQPLTALRFWAGGLHAVGAVAAALVAAPVILRWCRVPVARFADGMVPVSAAGIVIARVGCFLQGCCAGTVCHWPWCVTFPAEAALYRLHRASGLVGPWTTRTAPVHPLQLYFAGSALFIVLVGIWLTRRKQYDGQVGLIGLLLFGLSSALLEPLRADEAFRVYWGPLPQLLWSALALVGVAFTSLVIAQWQHRRTPTGHHAAHRSLSHSRAASH